ncbi:hypothetical protein NKG05_06005 [Oerskovia sp. M15]
MIVVLGAGVAGCWSRPSCPTGPVAPSRSSWPSRPSPRRSP